MKCVLTRPFGLPVEPEVKGNIAPAVEDLDTRGIQASDCVLVGLVKDKIDCAPARRAEAFWLLDDDSGS